MKKLNKYKNVGYALAVFFYVDLSVGVCAFIGNNLLVRSQIKEAAEHILETPNLTGIEPLDEAVQMDLCDIEKSLEKNL